VSSEVQHASDPTTSEPPPREGAWTRRGVLAATAAGIATAAVGGAALGAETAGGADVAATDVSAQPAATPPGAWKHALGDPRGSDIAVTSGRSHEARFGVMFKDAPAYAPPDPLLTDLAAQMREANPSPNLDNPSVMAGYTFLGQFIDHDMTLDRTPLPQQNTDVKALTNFDTPLFDLGSVYGRGPTADPQLYEKDGIRLLVAKNSQGVDDLPRNGDGTAMCGDARNDENLIVAQLHLLFLQFHNRCLSTGLAKTFADAQRLTRLHFQWIIVHDFLRVLVGNDVVQDFLGADRTKPAMKRQFYKPKNPGRPMMPIEYSVAAFRFGHSMVRNGYLMNAGNFAFIFGTAGSDLRGSQPVPARFKIDWPRFFPSPDIPASGGNLARLIDARLSSPLFTLPVVPDNGVRSLAERNLIRGKRLGLPSGQAVARAMGIPALSNGELGVPKPDDPGWGGEAPLWFYILREAELKKSGRQLGPVGGRIVAEVILGILDADKNSYLHAKGWQPTAPIARTAGTFAMHDLIRFAQGS